MGEVAPRCDALVVDVKLLSQNKPLVRAYIRIEPPVCRMSRSRRLSDAQISQN